MAFALLGRSRLDRKLRAIPEAVKPALRAELARWADAIVATAKSLVPVDEGALQDSIGWTWGRAPRGSLSLAHASTAGLTLTIYAGNDEVFHARWVEFGTTKMPAQPFFYVSVRANKKRGVDGIRKATRKAAQRAASGG